MQLGIPDVKPIVRGFDRPNLQCTKRAPGRERSRKTQRFSALFERDDLKGTGIIYTATIKNALEVQKYLDEQLDIPAAVYHSKLHKQDRSHVHELFMHEEIRAVVATNAFGLGIDKPNIRFVVHYDLPGSVEAYTQEAGRAGRDGMPSRCILIYRMSDTRVQNYFLTGKYPDIEEVQRVFGTIEVFGGTRGRRFDDRSAQDLAAAAHQTQSRSSRCSKSRATSRPSRARVRLAERTQEPRARARPRELRDQEVATIRASSR